MEPGVFGVAILFALVVGAVLILFAIVGLGLVSRWLVDKTLSTVEALACTGLLLLALALVVVLPLALKIIPALAVAGVWFGSQRWLNHREAERERRHLETVVERSRVQLERDPNAAVAYETLAQCLEQLGHPDQALEVLNEYRRRLTVPHAVLRWMVKLEVSLYGAPKTEVPDRPQTAPLEAAPERRPAQPLTPPEPTASADAVADALAAFDSPAPPARPVDPPAAAFAPPAPDAQPKDRPRTREEREAEAFAPPPEKPDVEPDFETDEPMTGEQGPTAGPSASRDRYGGGGDSETIDPLAPAYEERPEETSDEPFYQPDEDAPRAGQRRAGFLPPKPQPAKPDDDTDPFLTPAEAEAARSKPPLWEDPLAPAYAGKEADQPFYRPPEATSPPQARPLTPPPSPAPRRVSDTANFSNDPNQPAFDESDDDGQGAFYNPEQEEAELGKPAPPPKPAAEPDDPDEGKPAP